MQRIRDLLAAAVASTHGLLHLTITAFAAVFVAMFVLGSFTGAPQPGSGWGALAGLVWFYGLWLASERAT